MIMQKKVSLVIMLLSATLMIVGSCKKYPDPPPVFEKYGKDSSSDKQRKVLVISIDGVSGAALKEVAPPNIMKLQEHGKYSYNVLPSLVATDASSWVTLLTGVSYSKHKIKDSTFVYVPEDVEEGDHQTDPIPYFPSVFSYILPSKPQYDFALVTPWEGLAHYMRILDNSMAVADDAAVRDSAVALLQSSPSLGVMVVDFHEAELAGYAGDFSVSDAGYKAAILKTDEYVGDVIEALRSRENYDQENWLIMVTTNHGGSAASPQPGFVICANESLTKEEVKKAGFNTVAFGGSKDNAKYATMNPVVHGERVYDFQKDFTIQFDALFGGKSGSYPYFFGNKFQLNGSTHPGFSFLIDYDPTWTFNTTSGSKFQVKTNSATLGDSRWHTVGITVKENSDGSRTVSAYLDGEFKSKGDLPSGANLNNDIPLTIGWIPASGGSDFQEVTVHNIKMFDVALDAAAMSKNKCIIGMDGLANKENLVGFWACDEATGGVFLNSVNSQCPFILHGSFDWTNMGSSVPCSVTPPTAEESAALSIVPSNADISANILYWLKIEVKADWNIDGQPWLDNFENEIYDL